MKDYTGFGSLDEALRELAARDFRKVMVIASESGWKRFAAEMRPFPGDRDILVFSGFSPNPDFGEILDGVEAYRRFQPDLLFALGGGSPIDVAKAIKAFAHAEEPYDAANPQSATLRELGPPLVAVATTAGSGSEATRYAIFYVGGQKQSIAAPHLRPDMAVVDPEMTYSLPPAQTAATGFDALSQAVESYWSCKADAEARETARVAIGYILPNLHDAVHSPAPGNRYHMGMGAYLAGKAINITGTTLSHALAYHLTQEYGLPHGHAVAITMPFFFRINTSPGFPVTVPEGPERHARNMAEIAAMLGRENAEDCFDLWRNLMKACGLAARLPEVGVDSRDKVEKLVASINPAKVGNHPVKVDMGVLADFLCDNP